MLGRAGQALAACILLQLSTFNTTVELDRLSELSIEASMDQQVGFSYRHCQSDVTSLRRRKERCLSQYAPEAVTTQSSCNSPSAAADVNAQCTVQQLSENRAVELRGPGQGSSKVNAIANVLTYFRKRHLQQLRHKHVLLHTEQAWVLLLF